MSLRFLATLLLAGSAACAHAMTVPELQKMLQTAPTGSVAFQEVRESPWLSAPLASRGTLRASPGLLEKRVETPRAETWRLLPDRMEWTGPDGTVKALPYAQSPALQVLADVTRLSMAGDLVALQRDFQITLQGDERAWSAQLRPRGGAVARELESVELQGAGSRLQVVITTDRRGEKTTTRLLH